VARVEDDFGILPAMVVLLLALSLVQVRELSQLLDIPRGLELASAKVQKSFKVEGSPEAQAKVQAILRETFDPPRLRVAVENALAESIDAATVDAAIRFRKSPIARKLAIMEQNAQGNIGRELQSYAADLAKNPPAPARVAIVGRIIRSTRHVETAVEMSMDPLVAVGVALGRECGGNGSPGDNAKKLRDLQAAKMRDSAPVVLLFLYRAASDAELTEYAQWFESPDGQKLVGLTLDAIGKALNDAAETAGRRIGREVMRGHVTWCGAADRSVP